METVFLVLAALVCLGLLLRERRQRRLIASLKVALEQETLPSRKDLPLQGASHELRALARTTLDAIAEAQLQENSQTVRRSYFEALLNQIEDALFILDEDLEIRFSNRAAQALFLANAPQQGRALIEVCLDHRIVETVELSRELSGKTQERIQRSVPVSPGQVRSELTWLVEAEPLESVAPGATWLLIRDITEKLETEQIRRDFVANASHELRTPLSIIHGYLEMLEDGTSMKPEMLNRSVKTMAAHTERIMRIVDDMLTVSRLESGESLLKLETFDITDCILSTIEQLQPIISRQKAKLEVDLADENLELHGDRFYWNQILFNLMDNALKQNDDRRIKIRVSAFTRDGQMHIAVSDDGVGIPAADLPLIFKRFYRVEKHHAQTRKGTGLGLSIVRRAVEAHHGTISVISRPGIQTSFEIIVPQRMTVAGSPIDKNGNGNGGDK